MSRCASDEVYCVIGVVYLLNTAVNLDHLYPRMETFKLCNCYLTNESYEYFYRMTRASLTSNRVK